jgi:hypothetical protein
MPRGVNAYDEAKLQGRLWSPELAGPSLWFDAADLSTIATISGAVSEWRDKSGFGRHVSQTTGVSRPAYTAAGLNGLGVLTFDGVNDSLIQVSYAFPTVYSIYAVGRSSATSYSRLLSVSSGADIFGFMGTGPTGSQYATFFGNGVAWNDITSNTPTQSIASTSIIGVVKANAVGGAIPYVNGIAQNAKNGTTATASGFILGTTSSNQQYWLGIMAEIIMIPALSDNPQRQQIEGYLAHKWGMKGQLPASHPYINSPPLIGD